MLTRSFSESVELAAPAQFVYDFLLDFSTATLIDPAVISAVTDSCPLRAGTRVEIRFRMWGLRWKGESVIDELVPGRRYHAHIVKPSWPGPGVVTHTFEPTPKGCIYTWSMQFKARDPLGGIAIAMVNRFFRANARAQQQRVKAEVERRFASRAPFRLPPSEPISSHPRDSSSMSPPRSTSSS